MDFRLTEFSSSKTKNRNQITEIKKTKPSHYNSDAN